MEAVPAEELVAGTDEGGRPAGPDDDAPADYAFDGRGDLALADPAPGDRELELDEAVEAESGAMEELLRQLIESPTTLGREAGGQSVMRAAFEELGLTVDEVPMRADVLRAHPAAAPFDWDVDTKVNLVATWGADRGGRSLILNGHVDVVPEGPADRWTRPPFSAVREGGWVYGRGSADMKGGLAAIVGAVRGLQRLGLEPDGRVFLESVVEEECSGNGTLSTVLAGVTADAAVIAEPFGAAITTSQVGVLWFTVAIRGEPVHAADPALGGNPIEQSLGVVAALRELEAELNAAPPTPYDRFEHPINLNVGEIHGGDWPSSAPADCVTSFRLAFYPGIDVREVQARVEAAVARAAAGDPALAERPPDVRYSGFTSNGYELAEDHPLVRTLAGSFARRTGRAPLLVATTGTTDAGILGSTGRTPAVCFGPYGERAHAVDERVWFPSVVHTAQVMASFVKGWCGVSG